MLSMPRETGSKETDRSKATGQGTQGRCNNRVQKHKAMRVSPLSPVSEVGKQGNLETRKHIPARRENTQGKYSFGSRTRVAGGVMLSVFQGNLGTTRDREEAQQVARLLIQYSRILSQGLPRFQQGTTTKRQSLRCDTQTLQCTRVSSLCPLSSLSKFGNGESLEHSKNRTANTVDIVSLPLQTRKQKGDRSVDTQHPANGVSRKRKRALGNTTKHGRFATSHTFPPFPAFSSWKWGNKTR
jgi:hypothetical protein